jgi:TRAP-type mannitol/chloroaromatic compound transport system permease small subunit
MSQVIKRIDSINKYLGEIAKWALVVIMLSLVYEVMARYFFNRPTIWCTDVCEQGMIVLGSIGGAYSYLYDAFVRVDILYEKLSLRRKAIMDMVTFFIFALFVGLLIWQCYSAAIVAWRLNMRTATLTAMPLYPGKTLVCIGTVLLLLQGISHVFKNVYVLIHNKEYPREYKED